MTDAFEKPSKSQLKREAEAKQALGERLLSLSTQQLNKLQLPEALKEAIDLGRNMNSRGALRRQRQFIGRLMRDMDTTEIETFFKAIDEQSLAQRQAFKGLEKWRERLLQGEDNALTEFVEHYPACDVQALRQIIRQAQKELKTEQTSGKHQKKLFKFLRTVVEEEQDS